MPRYSRMKSIVPRYSRMKSIVLHYSRMKSAALQPFKKTLPARPSPTHLLQPKLAQLTTVRAAFPCRPKPYSPAACHPASHPLTHRCPKPYPLPP